MLKMLMAVDEMSMKSLVVDGVVDDVGGSL